MRLRHVVDIAVRQGWPGLAIALAVMMMSSSAIAKCDVPAGQVAAAPTRPIETNSPDPVQTGVLQIESGWAHSFLGGGVAQDNFNSLIKLGVWCNAEVRWAVSDYNFVSGSGPHVVGMGDNWLTAHYRLFPENGLRPSTAVSYTVKFPSASPNDGLGSGSRDHILNLMFGKTIHRFALTSDLFYFFFGQGNGQYNTKAEASLAVSHPLWRKWSATAEVYGDSRLNAANKPYANSTWVLNYAYTPRWIFDGGASVAITSGPGAPANTVFVGATWAIGNLYRGRKH